MSAHKTPGPFIKLGQSMPEHEKVEPLSDAAFRLLITAWCFCARRQNDGVIAKAKWAIMGTAKTRRELSDAGLVHLARNGDAVMHDYLEWQQSAEQINKKQAGFSRGAQTTNHKLHHVGKGKFDPDCTLCPGEEPADDATPEERPSERYSVRPSDATSERLDDAQPSLEVEVEGASSALRSSPAAPTSSDAAHAAATEVYEAVGKAGKFMAIKGLARWAMKDRELTHAQFVDAYVAVYRSGRPVLKESLGQYIDGHKRGTHIRSASTYLDAFQHMSSDNPPAIGA